MPPVPMPHFLIFLPGFMGSVLQKDGHDVWALSGQALLSYLTGIWKQRSMLGSLRALEIKGEGDPHLPDLGDGICATGLISEIHAVPGLMDHAGYATILKRIPQYFNVKVGSILAPTDDANFYPFPYDWRRDCRATAHKLQAFIDRQLPRWRAVRDNPEAQVILIGHSMGGIIARYYLEVLEGWRNCRALITVGSPHRGAPAALEGLSNDFSSLCGLFADLYAVVHSFRPAYQLLPMYPMVHANGTLRRVGEVALPNIDSQQVLTARAEVLYAIHDAALANRQQPDYSQCTIPWFGSRQTTKQTAIVQDGKLRLLDTPASDNYPTDGDGTVPRISAIPADLDERDPDVRRRGWDKLARSVVEHHGWLTNNPMALDPLLDTLQQLTGTGAVLKGGADLFGSARAAFNLRAPALCLPEEAVTLELGLVDGGPAPYAAVVEMTPVGHTGHSARQIVSLKDEPLATIRFSGLTAGLYQVTVRPRDEAANAPIPVHSVVEVLDAAGLQKG